MFALSAGGPGHTSCNFNLVAFCDYSFFDYSQKLVQMCY